VIELGFVLMCLGLGMLCFELGQWLTDILTSGEWKRQHGSEHAGPPTSAARS
jgi:hypothetical protein